MGLFLNCKALEKDTLTFQNPAFSINKNQWDSEVLFRTRVSNGSLWLAKNCLTFDLQNADDLKTFADFKASVGRNIVAGKKFPTHVRRHVFKIYFEGMNPQSKAKGYEEHYDYENYFIGNDKSKWASHVERYSYVVYNELYPKIDYKVYSHDGFLKWDFIVKPKGNYKDIKLKYEGVPSLSLANGNLVIRTHAGKIVEMKPYAYQVDELGNKTEIACSFKVKGLELSFVVNEKFDKTKELIIDPTLVYASYSGSTADNWGYTATYDYNGFIFGGGSVFSTGHYPTTVGAMDSTFNGGVCDIGITKYDPSSSNLIYSTYLGGSGSEVPSSLVVNSADELFILGTTGSSDYPTLSNSYDNSFNGGSNITLTYIISYPNGSDLCLSRLSSNGTQLLASSYFGGNGNDGMNSAASLDKNYADKIRGEILTDDNNNCYVVSSTYSSNLPTTSAVFQPSKGYLQDGMIAKFDNNLSNLIWCSYLGGNMDDAAYAVALTSADDIVVTGGTNSSNLSTTSGAFQTTFNGGTADGYVAKINKNGNFIYNMSYFGTTMYDQSFFVDIDRKDHIFLYGQTADTGSALIYNALWNQPHGGQFVSKLKSDLSSLIWSTNWGTSTSVGPDISPSAFMVDLCNRVYMSGWGGQTNYFGTTSGLPITTNAFQSTTDGSDYYFLVLKDDASGMDYGTFYGGASSHEHVDGGTSRFDNRGKLYQSVCAGCGGYSDFPTTSGCHSSTNNSSNCNNAVIKFDFIVPVVVADFNAPAVGCAPYQASFVSTSYVTSANATCHWDFGNGATSNSCNTTYTYNQGGIFNVTLIITDSSSCNYADTIVKQVAVIEGHRDTLPTQEICIGDFTQIGLLPINDPNVTYIWDNASTLSNAFISNPIATPNATTYYTLLFSNGVCTDTLVQLVKVYNVDANAGNDTTLCYSNITLQASGNYPGLTYQWSSNNLFTDTLNTSLSDSSLTTTMIGPTYYYLKISWGNTCYDTDSLLVEPRIEIATQKIQNPLCNGDQNGSISIGVMGGALPYNYQWSNGGMMDSITLLSVGSYLVTVTDNDGCFAIDSFNLTEPQPLLSTRAQLNIPCQAACIGKAWGTPSGGTPPYSWQWDDSGNQTTNPATNLCDGTYHVVITDNNNCQTGDTVVIIDSSGFIVPNAWVEDDTIYEGQSTKIHSNYFGQTYTYTWTPTTGLNNPNIYNPTASPTTTTTYYLVIRDQWGCEWYDTINIFVIDVICEEPYIFVPNAFTPDGDGVNDVLYVRSSVGYETDFKIFNRWGEVVFETDDIQHGWDGTYKGKKVDPGVFDYYLKLTCYNHEVFIKKGNITLIR